METGVKKEVIVIRIIDHFNQKIKTIPDTVEAFILLHK